MTGENEEWIIPFKGRNHSGATEQNFLWRSGSVYVMDNHRAALWCWLQEIDLKKHHSIIHIDQHTDTLYSRLDERLKNLPSWSASIHDYLGKVYPTELGNCPVIRWDNYLSIYLAEFGNSLKDFRLLTHGVGDKPRWEGLLEGHIWEIPDNLDYWLSDSGAPWIVNIDLDYFCAQCDDGSLAMVSMLIVAARTFV